MLGVALAQRGEAVPWFSSNSLHPCAQQLAAPTSAGRPEKCCLGRGEFDEHGKINF